MERLQKILAQAGIASRRKCEEFIKQGRVTVDGKIITELGFKVDPGNSIITFDGHPLIQEEIVYILLNKPNGYVTTLSDPQGRAIVTDLLRGIRQRVFPVGRLDFNTEGALILTNDGNFSQLIQHPSHEVNKTYVAIVKGIPSSVKINQLEKGIVIDGQKTWPAKVKIIGKKKTESTLELIIHEGKKRQVRKMLAAVGHPVKSLMRTAYGNLKLGNLKPGKYRFLAKKDLEMIFSGKIPFTIKKKPD
jgi:23S rRNA pseudouridine2605 synthase